MIDAVQEWNHDRLSELIARDQSKGSFQLGRLRSDPEDVDGPVEDRHTRHLDLELPQDNAFDR